MQLHKRLGVEISLLAPPVPGFPCPGKGPGGGRSPHCPAPGTPALSRPALARGGRGGGRVGALLSSGPWEAATGALPLSGREHRVQLSGLQRVRDHQAETQGLPGLSLHQVPAGGHAQGG